jgi:hypothetical protein
MQLRQGPPGYYINHLGQLIPESYVHEYQQQEWSPDHSNSRPFSDGSVTFGATGFTPKELVHGGMISGLIALLLGSGIPGALVMGMGSMIVEAGSTKIVPGWKRYALGLFRKPH